MGTCHGTTSYLKAVGVMIMTGVSSSVAPPAALILWIFSSVNAAPQVHSLEALWI